MRALILLSILVVAACNPVESTSVVTSDVSRYSPSERACLQSGFTKGTAEFTHCVSLSTAVSQEFEVERDLARTEATIGVGLAAEICDGHARSRLEHPVKRIISQNVSGQYVKLVDLSYEIDMSLVNPDIVYATRDVRCTLRGRELVDFNANT